MHTRQKENKYTQTVIEDSNNPEQEAAEIKNTVIFSLDSDEMLIEQNSAAMNTGEVKPIDIEGVCVCSKYITRKRSRKCR